MVSKSEKMLLITVDNHLKFVKNISLLCAKGNKNCLLLLGFPTTQLFIKKEH